MGSSSGSPRGGRRGARPPRAGRALVWPRGRRGSGRGGAGSGAPLGSRPASASSLSTGGRRRLLQDQVGVGAADAEGGDAGAAGARRSASQGSASVSSSISPASQSTLEEGASTCRVLGRTPFAHRHHHLDHPGDPGRGLGVADVGLDRAELQRRLAAPGRRWRAGRRPRSGRRGWCRCRGPRPRRCPWARGRRWPGPGGSPAPGRGRWGR